MHHGKLELQLKYGAVSRVTSSGPVVNDGQWRKVGRDAVSRLHQLRGRSLDGCVLLSSDLSGGAGPEPCH